MTADALRERAEKAWEKWWPGCAHDEDDTMPSFVAGANWGYAAGATEARKGRPSTYEREQAIQEEAIADARRPLVEALEEARELIGALDSELWQRLRVKPTLMQIDAAIRAAGEKK